MKHTHKKNIFLNVVYKYFICNNMCDNTPYTPSTHWVPHNCWLGCFQVCMYFYSVYYYLVKPGTKVYKAVSIHYKQVTASQMKDS